MTNQADLRHVWTVKADARYIRWYEYVYEANLSKLTFCRLFWGLLFSPFAFVFGLTLMATIGVLDKITDRRKAKLSAQVDAAPQAPPTPPKQKRDKVFINWLLSKLENGADRVSSFFQWLGTKFRKIEDWVDARPVIDKALTVFFVGVAAAVLLGGLAVGFYYWVTEAGKSLQLVGDVLACAAILLTVGFLFASFIMSSAGTVAGKIFARAAPPFAKAGKAVGRAFVGVGRFFAFGYHAFKTRTCPRVELLPGGELLPTPVVSPSTRELDVLTHPERVASIRAGLAEVEDIS